MGTSVGGTEVERVVTVMQRKRPAAHKASCLRHCSVRELREPAWGRSPRGRTRRTWSWRHDGCAVAGGGAAARASRPSLSRMVS